MLDRRSPPTIPAQCGLAGNVAPPRQLDLLVSFPRPAPTIAVHAQSRWRRLCALSIASTWVSERPVGISAGQPNARLRLRLRILAPPHTRPRGPSLTPACPMSESFTFVAELKRSPMHKRSAPRPTQTVLAQAELAVCHLPAPVCLRVRPDQTCRRQVERGHVDQMRPSDGG